MSELMQPYYSINGVIHIQQCYKGVYYWLLFDRDSEAEFKWSYRLQGEDSQIIFGNRADAETDVRNLIDIEQEMAIDAVIAWNEAMRSAPID